MLGPQQKLFRKAALEKMASPEQLDVMMKVTSPAGWLALWALGFALAAAVAWSIFGTIGIKVSGQGILMRGAAVLDVTASTEGRVEEMLVAPGDSVAEGDVVAKISQPGLALRIKNREEELATLRSQGLEHSDRTARILALYRRELADLQAKLKDQEDLLERGLITRGTVLATRQQISATEQSIVQTRGASAGQSNRVEEVERELRELRRQLAASTQVLSPYAGRVLELMVDPGNLVGANSRLLTVEDVSRPIEAMLYIPAREGKKVRPEMTVRISPSTVKVEEYGFILADVRSVSEYPITREGLRRVLRNQQLAEELTGESAPIAVVAELRRSEETESGFVWSSSQGPPTQIMSGTLCTVQVVVEEKRPISYVLPILKQAAGVS